MKRLCFLSPDVDHAQKVVQDLRDDGVEERHIYVIAGPDTPLMNLPDSGTDDNDFIPAFERGVSMGGAAGLLFGLGALAFPPAGFVIGGGGVLLIGMMSASLGGLLSGMAGAAYPSTRLSAFEQEIRSGKILVMVDIPKNRTTHFNVLIQRLDPEVEIEGLSHRHR